MTTGKTIALTRWIFVGKGLSLFFNMLSRLVIAFLSRRKCLLISWLQSPSAVIWEPKKIKSVTVSILSPLESDWTRCHDLSFLNVEFEANFFTLLFHFHQKALQFLIYALSFHFLNNALQKEKDLTLMLKTFIICYFRCYFSNFKFYLFLICRHSFGFCIWSLSCKITILTCYA